MGGEIEGNWRREKGMGGERGGNWRIEREERRAGEVGSRGKYIRERKKGKIDVHAFYNILVVSIGCPFTCALHYGMKHLKAMGKSQFKLPGWILKLVWDLSFTLVHCSTNMQCLLFTNGIVVALWVSLLQES